MERLTGRNEAGDLLLCGRTVYGNDEDVYNAVSLLDEYEDTNFEPSDIATLRNFACQLYGRYKTAHEGSCEGCRWEKGE